VLDVVVRGGDVVDGTGSPRHRAADVGIAEGRVVEIGRVTSAARRVIDAEGRVVAPGFVDVHTHYDAQAFWDPVLSPSPQHGVTTVIGGNCGFSLAPLREDIAEYVMKMLACVEGMPLESLEVGVPWGSWSTTGQYLDGFEGALAVNTGFLAGHSTIRRMVMGPAASERTATHEELDSMRGLLSECLESGALGFSSSWGINHTDGDNVPVPSRHADEHELIELAAVCRGHPGTSVEFIPGGSATLFTEAHRELVVEMSLAARRPLNWNLMRANASALAMNLANLEVSTYARLRGAKVVALCGPVEFPGRLCFLTPFILGAIPGWGGPLALPPAERLEVLSDPARRAELERLSLAPGDGPRLGDWGDKLIAQTFTPETKRYEGRFVSAIAEEEGKRPFDALLDIVVADGLRTTFTLPPPTNSVEDWDARRRIWLDERVVIGGSDAGAHLNYLASFNYTTAFLSSVRDQGIAPLERAVALLSDVPARLYGLRGRGRLAEGWAADVVVFDEEAIDSRSVVTEFDLPAGAGRLYADAVGIDHVLVNGIEVLTEGKPTGETPGTVLRSGRDTETAAMS